MVRLNCLVRRKNNRALEGKIFRLMQAEGCSQYEHCKTANVTQDKDDR